MKKQFVIFKKYISLEQAKETAIILKNHNIEFELDDNSPPVDVTFSGAVTQADFEIRINSEDFKKAQNILDDEAEKFINDLSKDYYLFSFSTEELYDVILKSDEWNELDYSLAKKLLVEKGENISEEYLDELKKARLEKLSEPEKNQQGWIIAGYLFSLLGGGLGLIIGYFLWTSKKTLPNGKKVYSYAKNDRVHGKYIFYIGVIIFPLSIIFRMFRNHL